MKNHALLLSIPLLLTVPLVGCGSSSPATDASNTTLATNATTANGVAANGVIPSGRTVVALPPEAPPVLLPDIPPPAPLANPVVDKDYGHFTLEVMQNYNKELTPYSDSLGRSISALDTLEKTPLQEPSYTEVITALHNAQTAIEDSDAHTKRLSRYVEKVSTQMSAMEIPNPINSARSHFQKGLTYIQDDMTVSSGFLVIMRDDSHALRDALMRGDRNAYNQVAAKIRTQKFEKPDRLELAFQEFKTAQQQYQDAPVS